MNRSSAQGIFARRGIVRAIVAGLLTVHAGLLAYSAYKHSPTWDEYGHLVAGISHWEFGRFDLYRVNPPLVRTIAAIPVMFSDYEMDWSRYYVPDGQRPERWLRDDFIRLNGARVFWLTTIARWACIPFSLIGGWACYLFASRLFGTVPGLLAVTLWCFCPNILGHGQLITPDVGAAALALTAHYVFWRYLRLPSAGGAISSGVLLGLTLLTKSTWIVLPPIWLAFWLVWWWRRRAPQPSTAPVPPGRPSRKAHVPLPPRWGEGSGVGGEKPKRPRWRELLVIALVSWHVLNLGYLFEGSFTRLGDYGFISRTFGGDQGILFPHQALPRNPYSETWFGFVPLPLPKNLVVGIDIQRWDLERKMWSYLGGEWKFGGWWYYYLYAMAIKVPLGIWGLGALALGMRIAEFGMRNWGGLRRKRSFTPHSEFRTPQWLDEVFLLAPAIAVVVLVSSQTGFNHHMRYVIPAFPFLFIWISQAASISRFYSAFRIPHSALVVALLGWFVGSGLYVYPHSMSYFNELVGGPAGGGHYLHNSNVDWGQDLIYLKEWYEQNPEARPLKVAYDVTFVPLELAGVAATRPPLDVRSPDAPSRPLPDELGPVPGWCVVSVNQLNHQRRRYAYLHEFQPVDRIGYTMNVYHITLEEANRVRRELGLPELPP